MNNQPRTPSYGKKSFRRGKAWKKGGADSKGERPAPRFKKEPGKKVVLLPKKRGERGSKTQKKERDKKRDTCLRSFSVGAAQKRKKLHNPSSRKKNLEKTVRWRGPEDEKKRIITAIRTG